LFSITFSAPFNQIIILWAFNPQNSLDVSAGIFVASSCLWVKNPQTVSTSGKLECPKMKTFSRSLPLIAALIAGSMMSTVVLAQEAERPTREGTGIAARLLAQGIDPQRVRMYLAGLTREERVAFLRRLGVDLPKRALRPNAGGIAPGDVRTLPDGSSNVVPLERVPNRAPSRAPDRNAIVSDRGDVVAISPRLGMRGSIAPSRLTVR